MIIIKRKKSAQPQSGMEIWIQLEGAVHCLVSERFNHGKKDCGNNAHATTVRIGVVHGFLVYMALVVDSNNNFPWRVGRCWKRQSPRLYSNVYDGDEQVVWESI